MPPSQFVFLDEYGLLGSNFYWNKHDDYGFSKEEVINAGLTSDRVQVDKDIIPALLAIDQELQKHNYRLYVKEGYRPEALYKLVFERRSKKFGEDATRRLVNIEEMPHATGKTVDVTLWDPEKNEEVMSRNREHGIDAFFIDYYKGKTDPESQHYQQLQDLLTSTMLKNGFEYGPKREYFHFNFK